MRILYSHAASTKVIITILMNTKCKHLLFFFFPMPEINLLLRAPFPTDLKMNFVNSWSLFNGLSFRILLSVCFFLKALQQGFLLSCQEWKAKFLLVAFGLDYLLVKFIYFAPAKLSEKLTFFPC